jgi:hypothetical protein
MEEAAAEVMAVVAQVAQDYSQARHQADLVIAAEPEGALV